MAILQLRMMLCSSCLQRQILRAQSSAPKAIIQSTTPKYQNIEGHITAPWHGRSYSTASGQRSFSRRAEVSVERAESRRLLSGVSSKDGTGSGQSLQETASRARRRSNTDLELRFLQDPVKLADHVRLCLRDGKLEKSLELAREASKRIACTVSWNHIMDYLMQQGNVNAAMKAYNEMKKRGQKADSRTHVLLLRGLSKHTNYPTALGKALAIYHSMFSPNTQVKPSIIHTNAVLKVCARAGDMDSIWGIAARLSERGPGAPDSRTFTIIFDAIRHDAMTPANHQAPQQQMEQRRTEAILKGRRMWDDIVTRWKAGDVMVDEGLVCAMGQLLLIGSRAPDWDDVFSLVQQTMNIPRLVPRLGSSLRGGRRHLGPDERATTDESRDSEDSEDQFAPLRGRSAGEDRAGISTFAFAKPGQHTLAILLEACSKLAIKKTGVDYWDLLTDKARYGVVPDSNNYVAFLRMLRWSRSSEQAKQLLVDEIVRLEDLVLLRKCFRIAMGACVRDRLNANSLGYAAEIMDALQQKLADTDIPTLLIYAELHEREDNPRTIMRAMEQLQPAFRNLRSQIAYGNVRNLQMPDARYRWLTLQLAQRMIGLYDRLLNGPHALDSRVSHGYKFEKAKLAAFVSRYKSRWQLADERKVARQLKMKERSLRSARVEQAKGVEGTEKEVKGGEEFEVDLEEEEEMRRGERG